jgi:hypothetical protein
MVGSCGHFSTLASFVYVMVVARLSNHAVDSNNKELSRMFNTSNIINRYCRVNQRCCYKVVINKRDVRMDKEILSYKSVFLIATMLSTMMLAMSSTASLVPITAFAQEDNTIIPNIEELAASAQTEELSASAQTGLSSTSEEDTSDNEGASTSEEDTSDNEGSNNNVAVDPVVDPVVETDAEVGVNANADTHVITDEADCEEANDEAGQANAQSIDQQDRSEGSVSPKFQYALEAGFNYNADTDVMLVECNPSSDTLSQANEQSIDQSTGNDWEGGTIVDTTYQSADVIARNHGINNDIMIPVL